MKRTIFRAHHFCSKECFKDGNILCQKEREKTCLERFKVKNYFMLNDEIKKSMMKKYGIDNPQKHELFKQKTYDTIKKMYGTKYFFNTNEFKEKSKITLFNKYGIITNNNFEIPEVREKIKKTVIKKYGVDNPFKSSIIRKKILETNIKRYNVDISLKSPIIRKKILETNIKRYGFSYPMQNNEIKEKVQNTNLEKYGVKSPLESKEIQKKIKETNIKKYGTEYLPKNIKIREKITNTMIKRYGVKNALQNPELLKKALETMKNNNLCWKSKPEEKFYEFLCEKFGKNNIIRQKFIFKWPIDFFIKNINLYLQFDGVFWHGLIKPLDWYKNHPSKKINSCYKKFYIDKEQDIYFKENSLNLLRITDKQFNNMDSESIYNLIYNFTN